MEVSDNPRMHNLDPESVLLAKAFGDLDKRPFAWCFEPPDDHDDLDRYIASLTPEEQTEIHALAADHGGHAGDSDHMVAVADDAPLCRCPGCESIGACLDAAFTTCERCDAPICHHCYCHGLCCACYDEPTQPDAALSVTDQEPQEGVTLYMSGDAFLLMLRRHLGMPDDDD